MKIYKNLTNYLDGSGFKTFVGLLDYSKFMQPKTDSVFHMKTKRIDFCRRVSHKEKMVMIVKFEGVIGDI